MARPDYAFRTPAHTAYAAEAAGEYRLEPGGARLALSLEAQRVPPEHDDALMERIVAAWLIARGGRTLNLNGRRREIGPEQLDRPAPAPVRRLVSIAPSNAEIVGALGATGLLVGVESSSDFPPEIEGLPRLGPDLHVDMAALAALKPDLVLASLTVPGMERNIAGLEAIGVPYLVLAPRNLAEIEADVLRTGRAIGHEPAAQKVAADMRARAAALRSACPAPARRVYLEWWPKPMFAPGAPCWSNELIELAGGENVFRHIPTQSGEVSVADVAAADPEVIFVSWCGVPAEKLDPGRVTRREGLEGVSAVRAGRVFPVDEALLGRPGPRVLDGVEAMARAIRAGAPPAGSAGGNQ